MRYIILSLIVFVFTYLIAYNSGYNRGYEGGQCAHLPFKEAADCWDKIK